MGDSTRSSDGGHPNEQADMELERLKDQLEVIEIAGSIKWFDASVETTVPARFRNVPETISSAFNSVPSALRVPRARSWSPGRTWSRVPALASSNLIESGA